MFLDSANGKRLIAEKSTFTWPGPRSTLRPTLPKSVPVAFAIAAPFELGIIWPERTTGRTKASGLKKYPAGTLLLATLPFAPGAQLGRTKALFPPFNPYKEPEPPSIMSTGRPDIAVTMPPICQLANRSLPAFECDAKAGRRTSQR